MTSTVLIRDLNFKLSDRYIYLQCYYFVRQSAVAKLEIGRNPSELKIDELRFWLKCHDDPGKGLRTKAEFLSGKLVFYVLFDRCIHLTQ